MWKAYALVMLAIILFSGNFIAGKVATAAIAPFTLAWLRTLIAFLLLLTFARQEFKYAQLVMVKNWKALYGMALTGVVLFPALVYTSLNYTTTINASIVEALTPSVAMVLGFLFLGEHFTPSQLTGVLVSFLGVLYIITQGSWEVLAGLGFNIGDLIMLSAVVSWAFYSLLVNKHGPKFPMYGSLLFMLGMGNVTLLVMAAVIEWLPRGFEIDWSSQVIWSVLYTGIFPAVIALIAWNQAVSMIGPSKAAVFLNLIPVVTAVMAFTFLGEAMTSAQLVGGVFVLGGVYMTTRRQKKREAANP
ncbi:multidrug DMT transporter [Thalassobacillus devorans]|uniref:Multidrug DMT transporter n=1 Tax=Thalassobacillus devorans TaxID=279813 RepID=A0ABQ1PCC6_9BACI|nr:DMT family transporter [Thalassobacillus devorans]NIK29150.1 drug/metabolite transporter (DMT)-like permease [Thalassobacillus devorans]GGC94466.1 multidrug DMT transporter [Thalassobacillus devorans]